MNRLFPGADIFQEMERMQQQLFGTRHGLPASLRASTFGAFPPVNVGSTPDSVEVVAFVPGIKKDEIEVTIDNGILAIGGERRRPQKEASSEIRGYAQERFAGRFRRAIELPPGVDPTKATARYENGCLMISIGKLETSKPRAITIA